MTVPAFHRQESQKVYLDDAVVLARLVGLLQQKGKPYRILAHDATTFRDLHNSATILIPGPAYGSSMNPPSYSKRRTHPAYGSFGIERRGNPGRSICPRPIWSSPATMRSSCD